MHEQLARIYCPDLAEYEHRPGEYVSETSRKRRMEKVQAFASMISREASDSDTVICGNLKSVQRPTVEATESLCRRLWVMVNRHAWKDDKLWRDKGSLHYGDQIRMYVVYELGAELHAHYFLGNVQRCSPEFIKRKAQELKRTVPWDVDAEWYADAVEKAALYDGDEDSRPVHPLTYGLKVAARYQNIEEGFLVL